MITTEGLLTSRDAFGISTATPCQRAACRIIDGAPLGELACDPEVVRFVGGAESLAMLPSERGIQPTEVILLAAIRCAKSILAAAAAIRATQTVDVSGLGPGEIPRVSVVSLKLDVSAVIFRLLLETIRASAVLRKLLVGEPTADSLMLRHPTGRSVEVSCVAGAKAGGGLVARWSAGLIGDEAPRMAGSDDAVVNLDHARSAILGRLLPGAQVLLIGSPFAPFGPIYNLVGEFWRKPTSNIVVLRGTGPMLNPIHWTPERCAKLREQDETAYTTDVLGEFADPESGLLSPIAVRRNTRETPLELPPELKGEYCAALDPSEGAAKGNAWTLVIVQRIEDKTEDGEKRERFRVALAKEWRGLGPEACLKEVATECGRYGVTSCWSDQYAASALQDLAKRFGLKLRIDKTTATSKLEDFTNLATMVHTDAIELPPDRVLRADLLSVKKRTTQTGITIVLPQTGDGRHADFAPALASAVKHSAEGGRESFGAMIVHRTDSEFGPPLRQRSGINQFFTDTDGVRKYRL